MTPEEIYRELIKHSQIEWVEGAKLPVTSATSGDPFLVVPAAKILEIAKVLKTREEFSFDCLSSLTAVDRFANQRFEVVYHLFSYKHRHNVTLKIYLERGDTAHLSTVESLWGCANWFEREVYDLFGIKFDQHSDLRRIMLPDDWVGHPLRKDYKEQEDYHGIATTRPPLIQ
ncbi:MAG: NADH-quinone oxidoreductase subunit C [Deltaproteobacteria bacterium]|nr:NADH-quinone oxidoreductase subunit C [Deltaproteobacteria bacterium]